MLDGLLDGRERVGCRHWNVHAAGRDHLGRLRYCWRTFSSRLWMAQPKASNGERLEDNVQRAYRHRTRAHRRIGDERTVRRERRGNHARRRAADTIEREAELSLTDRR